MEIKSVIRTAAILYADDSQATTQRTVTRKIIESVLVQRENKEASFEELVDDINSELSLEFTEDELRPIVDGSDHFVVRHNVQHKRIFVTLKPDRYNLLLDKEEGASIEGYIGLFIHDIYEGNLTADQIADSFQRFIYDLLNTNISAFRKLLGAPIDKTGIAIDAEQFTLDERLCINEFLGWNNAGKNRALFNFVSYAIEYALITNNVSGANVFDEAIQRKSFYLDINIIFRALGINGEHRQKRTVSFLNKCKSSGQSFFISKFSIDEFKVSIQHHLDILRRFPFNKINPDIFKKYDVDHGFYEFYHKWRNSRTHAYGFDLFHSHILALYKGFLDEFGVTEDYQVPFNENDREVGKLVESYAHDIQVVSGKSTQSAMYDARNVLFMERKRGANAVNIRDTKVFFVSADQRLRKWDFDRSKNQPIALLPTQWMGVLLKYFARSDDDYKSFASFLQLRLGEPVLRDDQMHIVLSGISEVTEDFRRQEEIFAAWTEQQIQKTLDGDNQDRLWEASAAFAKTIADERISDLEEKYLLETKGLATTNLAFKRKLLKEQEDSLSTLNAAGVQVDSFVESRVRNRKSLLVIVSALYLLLNGLLLGKVDWQTLEPVVFLFSVLVGVGFFIYRIISRKSWNPSKYLDEFEDQCRTEESARLNYDPNRVRFLYDEIAALRTEIQAAENELAKESK